MKNFLLSSPPKIDLTREQQAVISSPLEGSLLLNGESGCGKTTAGACRLRYLVEQGIPGDSILVLVPQRSLAAPYYAQIQALDFPSSSSPAILTFGGLAQRMVSLFWPLIAKNAGFASSVKPCRFLTLETAQYFLATLVEPLLEQGYFDSLTIDRNRLYSQILDNLNKSAAVGFPPAEIDTRLSRAWSGKPAHTRIYQQAQECALLFRDFCLRNNLLDFSLQLTVFVEHLWPSLICRTFLQQNYRHLIYDNIEEDIPVAHDVIAAWLPQFKSALLIQDSGGGFRTFLGADAESAKRFYGLCAQKMDFSASLVKPPAMNSLQSALEESLITHRLNNSSITSESEIPFSVHASRFYPEMMEWVVAQIGQLLEEKSAHPSEIVILTPFLSDSLRFSFSSRLSSAGIPFSTYRPSRSLRDEPAVQTLLTLAKIAHPSWNFKPTPQEVRNSLMESIAGCDLLRADLLSKISYQPSNPSTERLNSFDRIKPDMQARITFSIGERFECLRSWLYENSSQGDELLDHWLSRLFGEVLSQPGFGFHSNFDSAAAVSHLIESFRKFRQVFEPAEEVNPSRTGSEYIRVLEQGILAAQSLAAWTERSASDAVFLSPAFSFLMTNRPVKYQFWIDIGSQGWWSRLEQPLTQPYVLSRNWPSGKLWTDDDEVTTNQQTLMRLASGLIKRCSDHIYMCTITYNEQGMEERGALVMGVQNILRQINRSGEEKRV